ncbi:ubiquitin carboxyl-terminal hydrolase MINDY-1 [Neltuma alba]|uniref:ubiquitin carboxyl-terminal hydrolase MINDY-1 n=1 Tax=Neltuma alba TaxID=207710 RepID=UPI0010A3542E|nr:ubiquitin carboxyl-terminal hydrolase MINDY-1 [Prosopis alba]XP_028762772.1 ubiquitin carboxyl-terminal hydrolase MINDY-1 [Prosopis alba]
MASSTPNDEQRDQEQEQPQPPQPEASKEFMHKTKTIQFLGRTTPIVLQNENGPCPLLAICNVLLLRNHLNLSPDVAEVSQEKLLSLVAERLIDSNSNVNNKDAGYVKNQLQNISDAIDLLPRLATGIDVNIKFKRINDFEFTPECAIFDLLDISLYHGWIVDPQDYDSANAIGSKSYNALTGELVALETRNMEGQHRNSPEEDCVDFVAATTAALGVPSPSLSKTRSFDDSPRSVSDQQMLRKGDLEEEAELLRALKLSEVDSIASVSNAAEGHVNGTTMSVSIDDDTCNKVIAVNSGDEFGKKIHAENNDSREPAPLIRDDCICTASDNDSAEQIASAPTMGEVANLSNKTDGVNSLDQLTHMGPKESINENKNTLDTSVRKESEPLLSSGKGCVSSVESHMDLSEGGGKVHNQPYVTTNDYGTADESHEHDPKGLSCLSATDKNSESSSGRVQQTDVSEEALSSSIDGSEPIYEGEECVLDKGNANFQDNEPVYEGEVVLAKQADKGTTAHSDARTKDEITPQQGELIRSFLRNNASQLTFYGLFCLQEGLEERELCVFFRNNHFSTMFKYEGELYLLATDQGYINQPDLVWEKLNEVNGDTLFMTGNFKEFKVESQDNNPWDEHNAVTSTADYLASINSAAQAGLNINSDLQLAIALQQQEFEQPPPRQNSQQPSSRLVTGPQAPRNSERHSSSSSKAEGKSKEKCTVM